MMGYLVEILAGIGVAAAIGAAYRAGARHGRTEGRVNEQRRAAVERQAEDGIIDRLLGGVDGVNFDTTPWAGQAIKGTLNELADAFGQRTGIFHTNIGRSRSVQSLMEEKR